MPVTLSHKPTHTSDNDSLNMEFTLHVLLLVQAYLYVYATALSTLTISTYASIPTQANEPVVNTPPGYRVQAFGQGAYMVTDGIYQGLFFVATDSVIVVDAPPTIGEKFLQAIESVTSSPVSHVVYSHAHADHIGAAYLFGSPSKVTFVAHQLTADELAQSPDYKHRPAPAITFESEYSLKVGNQSVELKYLGPSMRFDG